MLIAGGGVAEQVGASRLPTIPGPIRLQCPRCAEPSLHDRCLRCRFQFREVDGIIQALPPERIAHFAPFARDYEHIRAAEGRGSVNDDFYLALPYDDISGKHADQWKIRARTFECLLMRVLMPRLAKGASVLDLGAGNCWLSYRLALEGYRPAAVDLLTNAADGLGAAEHYRNYIPEMFPRFRAELARLPFADGQFDAIVFNASYHYAEDAEVALREALRCVPQNGLVIISDSPCYSCDESGRQMVAQRRAHFLHNYETASDAIDSLEYLTPPRLHHLEDRMAIHWETYSPDYGLKWAMRPFVARLRRRREPAHFRIYVARKGSQ